MIENASSRLIIMSTKNVFVLFVDMDLDIPEELLSS